MDRQFIITVKEPVEVDEVTEKQVSEMSNIFENTRLVWDAVGKRDLIYGLLDKVAQDYKSFDFCLFSIYLLGYISGIRAERKRRKRVSGM